MMRKRSLNKIISILIATLGLISAIITIINGTKETIDHLSNTINPLMSSVLVYVNVFIILPLASIIIGGIIANFFTREYRKKIGTHGIPCTFLTMFHFKIANKNNKLLYSIHKDYYHHCYNIKDDLLHHKFKSKEEIDNAVEEFLRIIHSSILKTFHLDLTINIKRLSIDRNDNLCLAPFAHFRNIAVRNQTNPRDFNYSYYIQLANYERLSKFADLARQYGKGKEYEVNSIFTYLINEKKRYWISNNLKVDEVKGDFYTSSDNYPEYYQSLAVFSITPPEKNSFPEWLLVLDSKKTGIFTERECVHLFGYIAHLLYELLTEYDKL